MRQSPGLGRQAAEQHPARAGLAHWPLRSTGVGARQNEHVVGHRYLLCRPRGRANARRGGWSEAVGVRRPVLRRPKSRLLAARRRAASRVSCGCRREAPFPRIAVPCDRTHPERPPPRQRRSVRACRGDIPAADHGARPPLAASRPGHGEMGSTGDCRDAGARIPAALDARSAQESAHCLNRLTERPDGSASWCPGSPTSLRGLPSTRQVTAPPATVRYARSCFACTASTGVDFGAPR